MATPGKKSFCMMEYHTSKSVVTVKRAFRAKYAQDPPTDKTIRAWYKQFTETGCLCKQKSSGRPLTAEDDVEWFGPGLCIVWRNQQELQLRSYRCRKQQWRVLPKRLVFKLLLHTNASAIFIFYFTSIFPTYIFPFYYQKYIKLI